LPLDFRRRAIRAALDACQGDRARASRRRGTGPAGHGRRAVWRNRGPARGLRPRPRQRAGWYAPATKLAG
jgi:hypothetical protein